MTDTVADAVETTRIPPDDPTRLLSHARTDDPSLRHVGVSGSTFTILLDGRQTAGRYALIEMYVPPGAGPPVHRHDFEEMFSVLEGEIELKFRGEAVAVRAGETVNIPANAPHAFTNASDRAARMLCLCSPAGEDEYFLRIGAPVDGPMAPPPRMTPDREEAARKLAHDLAPEYRTEVPTRPSDTP